MSAVSHISDEHAQNWDMPAFQERTLEKVQSAQ
jgi:hypothetical protein